MAGSLNKVMIIGRLGKDPELRYTPGGQPVANFSVATTESWGGGQDKQERTEWHNIVLWGKQAETANTYLKKGRLVYIEGRLQTRKWQAKDGSDRYTTEIVATRFQFLESKSGGGESGHASAPAPSDGDMPPSFDDEDDIPF